MEQIFLKLSIMLVPALFAVSLHEVAHGYVADRFGDPTARLLGRLNVNPLRHLDPIGTLALMFFGFGWAKPVPVNFANLSHPKRDMVLVALAGPLTNFALAIFCALILRGTFFLSSLVPAEQMLFFQIAEPLTLMAGFGLYINLVLGVFNLIPLPPLDGGRVATGLLPARYGALLAKLDTFGFILVIFLLFFTPLYQVLIAPVILGLVHLLAGQYEQVVYQTMNLLFGH